MKAARTDNATDNENETPNLFDRTGDLRRYSLSSGNIPPSHYQWLIHASNSIESTRCDTNQPWYMCIYRSWICCRRFPFTCVRAHLMERDNSLLDTLRHYVPRYSFTLPFTKGIYEIRITESCHSTNNSYCKITTLKQSPIVKNDAMYDCIP